MKHADDRIGEGDLVHVDINSAQCTLAHRATVRHVPIATGDSWVFRDAEKGTLIYCSEGCTITLLEKAE